MTSVHQRDTIPTRIASSGSCVTITTAVPPLWAFHGRAAHFVAKPCRGPESGSSIKTTSGFGASMRAAHHALLLTARQRVGVAFFNAEDPTQGTPPSARTSRSVLEASRAKRDVPQPDRWKRRVVLEHESDAAVPAAVAPIAFDRRPPLQTGSARIRPRCTTSSTCHNPGTNKQNTCPRFASSNAVDGHARSKRRVRSRSAISRGESSAQGQKRGNADLLAGLLLFLNRWQLRLCHCRDPTACAAPYPAERQFWPYPLP
jgi:hypothetical protein